MKKLIFLISIVFLSINTYSQYRGTRQNVTLTTTEDYVTNSPGSSISNSRLIARYKDSTEFALFYNNVRFSIYNSTRNDGTPSTILWTDGNGNIKKSTIPNWILTETDPLVPAYAKSLNAFSIIKTNTDALYEPIFSKNTAFNKSFGTIAGTIAEGNDSRILNGQTAFGWGNHAGLYPLLSSSYSNPSWITSLAYGKLTGTPTIPTNNNQLTNGSNYIDNTYTGFDVRYLKISDFVWSGLVGKPTFATVATSGSYNDLSDKPTIPTNNNQLTNGNNYITASSVNTLTNKTGNISQWTNDSGYLTTIPAQSFSSLTGKPTTIAGYGITDAYPLTGNPSGFLTTVTSGQISTALGYTPLSTTGNGSSLTGITSTQISGLGTAATTNSTTYATAAQGTKADTALQAEIDGSITNEIQTLSLSGNSLSISGGNSISLPIIDYTNTVAVAGGAGNAVFYLTSDKTSTGTALYTTINYVNPVVNDSAVNYTYGWSYNSVTKALTVNVKQAVGINVALVGLTLLGVPSPVANGLSINVHVKGN